MKNLIYLFLCISLIGYSCTNESEILDQEIEQREDDFCDPGTGSTDPSLWCDGGADTWPGNFSIISFTGTGNNCCISVDLTSTFANTGIAINTSGHDYIAGNCSGEGESFHVTTDSNGEVTQCWEPIGTHFLIDIPGVGCYVFENPDGNCEI
jgi:hypothetical protein